MLLGVALLILAYILSLAIRIVGFSLRLASRLLQKFAVRVNLIFPQPTAIAVVLLSRSSIRCSLHHRPKLKGNEGQD